MWDSTGHRLELTAAERLAVLQHGLLGVLEALGGGISQAAALRELIEVASGDMLRLATVTAQVGAAEHCHTWCLQFFTIHAGVPWVAGSFAALDHGAASHPYRWGRD